MDFSKLSYLSKTSGIGGKIKHSPSDFIVEEITLENEVICTDMPFEKQSSGTLFTIFAICKENWTTHSIIDEISKRLRINPRFFTYAGIKDRSAKTTQLICIKGDWRNQISKLQIKDVKILGSFLSNSSLKIGDLSGNRFTIKLFFEDSSTDFSKVSSIKDELNGFFPNYFGPQRFGSNRLNTHLIGQKIIQNDLKGAIDSILGDIENETNSEVLFARSEYLKNQDLKEAQKNFPKHLRIEHSLIEYLIKKPNDFSGALKNLPRSMALLYVHAFQSYLFNLLLSERLSEGELLLEEGEYFAKFDSLFPNEELPAPSGPIVGKLIGFQTILSKREKKILDSFNLSKENFKIKSLPDLSSKGGKRLLLCPLINFNFSDSIFTFTLPSGSYATSLLREFMDKK